MAKPKKKAARKARKPAALAKPLPPQQPPPQEPPHQEPPHQEPPHQEPPPETMQQHQQEPPAGVDSGSDQVDTDAPGRSELEALASEQQPAAAGPGEPIAGNSRRNYVITDEHREIAGFLTAQLCDGLEGVLPIKYSEKTRAPMAAKSAPLIAKWYDKFPGWYLDWKEEIAFGMFMGGVIAGTIREVKNAQARQAEVEELAREIVKATGCKLVDARQRAMSDLGYEVEQPAAAAAQG